MYRRKKKFIIINFIIIQNLSDSILNWTDLIPYPNVYHYVWFSNFGDTLNQQRLKTWAHLLPFYDVKLHSLSIPNATKIFPWVVLLNGGLDTNQKQSENILSLKAKLVCQYDDNQSK